MTYQFPRGPALCYDVAKGWEPIQREWWTPLEPCGQSRFISEYAAEMMRRAEERWRDHVLRTAALFAQINWQFEIADDRERLLPDFED